MTQAFTDHVLEYMLMAPPLATRLVGAVALFRSRASSMAHWIWLKRDWGKWGTGEGSVCLGWMLEKI
jgi:hypothetical protein